MTPSYIQWTIPSVLYQTRRENPLVHKGLKFTPIICMLSDCGAEGGWNMEGQLDEGGTYG